MKCQKCKHRTDSRHHQYYCLGRRGTQIKRRAASRAGSGAGRHTAASALRFGFTGPCATGGPINTAAISPDAVIAIRDFRASTTEAVQS